ncbi:5'-nucleotidase C-terminal domain-containing protein [Zunongwangia sp.]|uniref:5'-nucleotidase C-terminal domain-containing protein n=1 Tax=Zunongwangia sp. TaxID=1965325 RepID=UPI003AA7B563
MLRNSFIALILLASIACGRKKTTSTAPVVEGIEIPINQNIESDTAIENFIAPYKEHLHKTLDSNLVYNPTSLEKSEKGLNTGIGNLMADIIMEQAEPIFKKRTEHNIDFALLNYGGIRADLNKGYITTSDAYRMMPFENEIVVAELTGEKVNEILAYLEKTKTAHPVSGIKIVMNSDYKVTNATINGRPILADQSYYVATSDYLQQGGDNMNFFKNPVHLYHLDYKLRNAIIDYFEKTDTLHTKQDDRFYIR